MWLCKASSLLSPRRSPCSQPTATCACEGSSRAFPSSGGCAPCPPVPGREMRSQRTELVLPQKDPAIRRCRPVVLLNGWGRSFSRSRVCFQRCFRGCDGLCSTLNLFKRGCMSSGLLELLMAWCFNCMSSMAEHYKLWLGREQFRAVYLWQLEKNPHYLQPHWSLCAFLAFWNQNS